MLTDSTFHLGNAKKRMQLHQTALFYKVHQVYSQRIAKGLNIDINQIKKLAKMSKDERVKATS